MRVVDGDLIGGGHYGQRSCEPHLKAEHMVAVRPPNLHITPIDQRDLFYAASATGSL
jgi:hypothetical protein